MAYSRTPEFNTHEITRLPVGDSARLDDLTTYSINYFNCLPRTVKHAQGKSEVILEKRPSYAETTAFGGVELSSTYPKGAYIAVATNVNLYCIVRDNAVYVSGTNRLTLASSGSNAVYFTEAVVAGVHYIVVLEEGSTSYVYTINTSTWATATATLTSIRTAGPPVFLNGRIYVAQYNTQRIYNSDISSLTTWNTSIDYIDAEMIGDIVVQLALHKNFLVAFGRTSIEFFEDAAIDIGSPLLRQASYSVSSVGLTLGYTTTGIFSKVVQAGNAMYFLGQTGTGIALFRLHDFRVTKVSIPFLDRTIETTGVSYGLYSIKAYGRVLLVISPMSGGHFYVYDPDEDKVAKWDFPIYDGGYVTAKFIITSNTTPTQSGRSYFIGHSSGEYIFHEMLSLTNFNTTGESVYATITYANVDFGNNLQKHFKYADVLGLFGNNTVGMTFTKDPVSAPSGTEVTANDNSGGMVRFRNLCRARTVWIVVSFTGTSQISVTGIEVAYNKGTV